MQAIIDRETYDHKQECFCETPEGSNFVKLDHGGSMIRYCVACRAERREYVFEEDGAGELEPPVLDSSQIQTDRVVITNVEDARNKIKVGDHIAWSRSVGVYSGNVNYSHHAIVTSKTEQTLDIVHYAGENDNKKKFTVHSKTLQLSSQSDMQYNMLFCLTYPKALTDNNPASLVVSRASSKLRETSYNLFWNNCESFATFCKRGVSRSLQVSEKMCSVLNKIGRGLACVSKSPRLLVWTAEFIGAEGVESVVKAGGQYVTNANVIGGVFYFVAEGMFCCVDIYQLFGARHDGRITESQFKNAVIKKILIGISRGVVGTGSSIVVGVMGAALGSFIAGPIGAGVGLFSGSVVGGVGGVATLEGSRTIFWSLKNSENVTSITELNKGDHIVLPGDSILHPRCHALVVYKDEVSNRVEVIRNDYSRGVLTEWIPFVEMKRIKYGLGESYVARKVIERASSHIGERRYNIITFNCKTFARAQKMKEELNF